MAKTIFGTTEKSNFILNMKKSDLQRYCCNILLLSLVLLSAALWLFDVTLDVETDLANKMQDGNLIANLLVTLRTYSSSFAIGGVLAMIFAIIGISKKQYTKRDYLFPALLCGGMFILSVLSFVFCFDYGESLFGMYGRNEGLLAGIFYLCFFFVGTMLRTEKMLTRFLNGVTCIGLAGCFWALLQSLPITAIPSSFQKLDPLLLERVFLPSGLTGNPVAFAMLLTMLGGISAVAALYADNKKTRIFHTVSACVFLFFLLKTQCIAAIIGAAVLIAGLILILILRKNAIAPIQKIALFITVLLCSVLLAFFAPAINGTQTIADEVPQENGYYLYDGAIVWKDGYYRLNIAGPYSPFHTEGQFEIDDAASVHKFLWKEAADVIRTYPLLGTGPDNYTYALLKSNIKVSSNANLADRPYNDILYIAATRGIPFLLCYLALIALAVFRAFRHGKATNKWIFPALTLSLIGYVLTSICGISVILVAPLFWMLLGSACGPFEEESEPADKKTK